MANSKYTNLLINETSPYLLQHAHNPVNWLAWNNQTLELAKRENKLLIISIGYSACHWCHVMEEESFENEDVATVMNDKFICIKVDREERPDIDHIYMTALQLITGRGGWPLNVIALPDGRPVWAASYVPKRRWTDVISQIAEMYKNEKPKLLDYAEKISHGIKGNDVISKNESDLLYTEDFLEKILINWKQSFDNQFGGYNYAPKFPLPNNLEFLLKYATLKDEKTLKDYVHLTLEKMAFGGIYDHVEGGFSRYSTDMKWHIPHFEKMLYDNAQLVSLYSKAYAVSGNQLYKEIVIETLNFIKNELTGESGNFYSALDADSLNVVSIKEEGAYYVWTEEELRELLEDDYGLFGEYYNVNEFGKWEGNKFVLIRSLSDEEFSEKHNIDIEELKNKVRIWKNVMANAKNAKSLKDAKSSRRKRKKRNKPELDDKSLCSWNALMLNAYIDAYKIFSVQEYLDIGLQNAECIKRYFLKEDEALYHNYAKGKSTINGFLEDYATVIHAFISLYQASFDEHWLELSKKLADFVLLHFFNADTSMFYFSSDLDMELISRNTEVYDGVISSGNSIMARDLFYLSHYYGDHNYRKISEQMLNNMLPSVLSSGSAYSNWLSLYADFKSDFFEIAITGPDAYDFASKINNLYIPNSIIAASQKESELPILKDRSVEGETNIFICIDGACQLPVKTVEKAVGLMKSL